MKETNEPTNDVPVITYVSHWLSPGEDEVDGWDCGTGAKDGRWFILM